MTNVSFGVHLPNSGGGAVSPDSLVNYDIIKEIAVEAEKLGYNSIWANEHLTLPTTETPTEAKFYEPLTLLSSLSWQTRSIILGTAIVILPFRDPFVLAKEATTLSEISQNRFVLGVGPGRFEREYLTQSKNWKDRNKILEEQIQLLRQLCSGNSTNFSGKYFTSKDFVVRPSPEKLPIILGGSGPLALKRAAKLCDGIMPGHITVEQAAELHRSMNLLLEGSSNQRSDFTFYNEIIVSIDKNREKAKAKFSGSTYVRRVPYATDLATKALIGQPEEITEKIKQYSSHGVQEFVLIFSDESESEFLESMELFSSTVVKKLSR